MTGAEPMLIRILLAVLALAVGLPAVARDYEVAARIWIDGELRGTPTVVVEPDTDATIEAATGDSGWRMDLRIEPALDAEGAEPDAVWIRVGISEKVDGQWQFLTDTMLGTRLGTPGQFSVVEDAGDEGRTVPREEAALFVELTARAAGDEPDE